MILDRIHVDNLVRGSVEHLEDPAVYCCCLKIRYDLKFTYDTRKLPQVDKNVMAEHRFYRLLLLDIVDRANELSFSLIQYVFLLTKESLLLDAINNTKFIVFCLKHKYHTFYENSIMMLNRIVHLMK